MRNNRFAILLLCVMLMIAMFPVEAFALDGDEATPREFSANGNENINAWQYSENDILPAPDMSNIIRIAGEDRYETSLKIAEIAKTIFGGYRSVILVSGTDFPDALGAAGPSNLMAAPIILVNKNKVSELAAYLGNNLLSTGKVYIMGGNQAVPKTMETELLKAGLDQDRIIRLEGANRYDTNLAVLKNYETLEGVDLQVCSGRDFADALSASAIGGPILLVGESLTDNQKTFIAERGIKNFNIIGGKVAVSEAVEADLKSFSDQAGGTVTRISGSNRFETSKAVAETFWEGEVKQIVVSYGLNYPDGLCGATVCFMAGIPMLLVTNSSTSSAREYARSAHTEYVTVLGGKTLISDEAALSILQ